MFILPRTLQELPIAGRILGTATRVSSILLPLAVGAGLIRRTHGVCRACGRLGSASDPLTVFRRRRVHTRHLPNIRASVRNSRAAARAARRGAL